MKKIFTTREL